MKAEIRFENEKTIVRITDVRSGQHKDFETSGYLEAEAIIRDYDRMRAMYLGA